MRGLLLLCLLILSAPALAADKFLDIKEVKSKGGITAWLVEDHTVPVVALRFTFLDSGSSLESEKKQGLVRLLSNTMDEGAGDLTSTEFQKALLDQSITLQFSSGRDGFGGFVKTLTRHEDKAFELMALALSKPRFDADPVQRMKDANLSRIRSSLTDPEWMAARLTNAVAFEGHPYALNSGGTLSTLPTLTADDLRAFHKTYLTRDRLVVAVAGAISVEELADRLDALFGALPEKGAADAVPDTTVRNGGTLTLYKQPIPQTLIEVMMPAFGREDPAYYSLQIMNFIFGGAGFGSRLMEEVREKRGLTYGIYSSVINYRHLDALSISLSTQNDKAAQALAVIRAEMARLVNEPVSEQELEDAKSYLVGSMPLALSSTEAIAGILLSLQEDKLPIDYLDHYAEKIRAVRPEDIQRVAVRLLNREGMTVVMVGEPQGLEEHATIMETLPNVR